MGKIIINQLELSFQEIQEGQWPELKPYFEASLLFCQEWLSEGEDFKLQTSGSTGAPKIIRISRAQMVSSAKATGKFFNLAPQASLLCCLNTAMIAGKMMLVRAMEWDSILYLVEPSSNPLMSFAADQSFDFAAMVPLQLENSLEQEHSSQLLHRIKNLIIGGAPISPAIREKTTQLAGSVYQTYGMTETVSHIALANLKAPGPLLYKILPEVRIRQSSGLGLEIIAPMSNEQWITTNDVVDIVNGSGFIWKGRSDFTINTGGVKVQPEEAEAMLSELMEDLFPRRRFFITSLPDAKLGQKVILIVEGERGKSTEEALNQIRTHLPRYHAPKAIYFVAQFKTTPSNKINRQATFKSLRPGGD